MVKVEDIKNIAVVGFGLMGSGIAQTFAQAGYNVVGRDVNEDILRRGMESIKSGPFGVLKAAEKGKIPKDEAEAIINRIKTTTDLREAVKDADFIVEAVFEDLELKKKVFAEVDEAAPPHAIIVSNTSSLPITAMAAATKRPDKVAGMHFFNPAPVMRLVEVIRGLQTSDETVEVVRGVAIKLGKTPVIVNRDITGFIANRIGILGMLEAIKMLENGVATKEDIDNAMKLGYNWPMGPFELADLVGLDTLLLVCNAIYNETGDPRYFPPDLLKRMVTAGNLGRKVGKGFYEYKK